MFKVVIYLFAVIACSFAKPAVLAAPLAYSAPLVAAPVVTAQSSQFFARNYNGLAAAYTAPVAAAYTSPVAAAYTAPVAAAYTAGYTAPLAAAYTAPLAYSGYASYPYASTYTTFL